MFAKTKEPPWYWTVRQVVWEVGGFGRLLPDKIHQFPVRAKADGITELFFVVGKVILIFGLVMVPDIDTDSEVFGRAGTFMADPCQPYLVGSELTGMLRAGFDYKTGLQNRGDCFQG